MSVIVGRKTELALLDEAYNSAEAELIAIYGRRRIGKTYLIKNCLGSKDGIFLHATGLKDGTLKAQLEIFTDALNEAFNINLPRSTTWMNAFKQLSDQLIKFAAKQTIVVFLDELPWMASPRSRLLQALDHYWNTNWVYNQKIKVVICGSAAAWILDNIVNAKGGLHNRLTRRINLQPFTLPEAKEFLFSRGVKLNNDQIIELYMAFGGVPHYLKEAKPGLSAQQIISRVLFSKESLLFNEYKNLLASLFKHSGAYAEILENLSSTPGGADKKQLAKHAKKSSIGGTFSKRLEELESAGFIKKFIPYGKSVKDIYYKLIDEYTIFYLKWITAHKYEYADEIIWQQLSLTSAYKAWSGFAFEALCYKHINLIKSAMNLERISAKIGTWRYIPSRGQAGKGAQIDLIFDRIDRVISLCEIKYTTANYNFTKQDMQELQHKQTVFQEKTGCNQQVFWCLITTNAVAKNARLDTIVLNTVAINQLF